MLLCASGAAWSEFLEVLEAAPAAEPQLLITEVTMAEISGVDLEIRVKEQCPTYKALFEEEEVEASCVLT
jgi:FixJ family two-component response regulator